MDISIPNIWQRVGLRSGHQEVKAETLLGSSIEGPFLLVLHWPVTVSYLHLSVQHGTEEPFRIDQAEVLALLREHQIPEERVPS